MKNVHAVAVLSLVTLMLIAAPTALASERMKSGQWEATFEGNDQSRTSTQCVTAQEVKAINGTPAEVREGIEKTTTAANCTFQNFKMDGDTVSYTTACAGTSVDTTTSYHGDSYEMVMLSKGVAGAQTRRVKARRLGPCL